MTYPEAIRYLYDLQWFGAKLGLENPIKLAKLLGHPEQRLRFIHVAGTNGKGSTCAILDSLYRAAGYRVGLFTSPHLVSFTERIQIDRQPISESDVVRLIARMRQVLSGTPWKSHPTFFEVVMVMALVYFAERECDLVLWETGMGGRLDATNIVAPLVSVITNVQLDHQKWLGATIREIAQEKAGIIKPGIPVLTSADDPEALDVIRETARDRKAPFVQVDRREARLPPLDTCPLSLPGEHQSLNAALALAVVRQLADRYPVTAAAIELGLKRVNWPGRGQLIARRDGRRLLLDAAHNPSSAEALCQTIERHFPHVPLTLLFAVMQDKDWEKICRILAPGANRIGLLPVKTLRSMQPDELVAVCRETNPTAEVRTFPDLTQALAWTEADPLVVITGSIYFLGEAMEELKLSPAARCPERGLNDYVESPNR